MLEDNFYLIVPTQLTHEDVKNQLWPLSQNWNEYLHFTCEFLGLYIHYMPTLNSVAGANPHPEKWRGFLDISANPEAALSDVQVWHVACHIGESWKDAVFIGLCHFENEIEFYYRHRNLTVNSRRTRTVQLLLGMLSLHSWKCDVKVTSIPKIINEYPTFDD